MKKKLNLKAPFIFLFILIYASVAFTQNPPSEEHTSDKEQKKSENGKTEETSKKEISETEERRNIILYGLADDILELIKTLQNEKEDGFDSDLQKIFTETKVPAIRNALFAYFAQKKNSCLKTDALIVLENRYEYPKDTVNAAIAYIRDLEISDGIQYLREILKDEDSDYTAISITALGKIGGAEDAVFLSELFESDSSKDEKETLILKQNIMFALEELHSGETWDFLEKTAADTEENSIIRGTAAAALGKIGDEKAVPVLTELFEDKDPVLRTAAIKGLAGFKTEKARAVLLQAFKDTYYKVRLQAIQSAKEEKNPAAVPYILYRAKKDPENTVRIAAIEALSELNDGESNEWIKEAFNDEKTGITLRLKIAEYFLKNNFDFIYADIEKETLVSLSASNKQKNKFASELGKIISKIENGATAKIAEAFMNHKEVLFKSIGLDMFKLNKYSSLAPLVSAIAENESNGALSRRAKTLLEQAGSK